MKFYERYFAGNYEKLLTYYPRFYQDVWEMREILKAQGRLADELEDDIEQVFLNCFLDYANEAAICRLEQFLKLKQRSGQTLDERRRVVKSYFLGFGKLSASLLAEIIQNVAECPPPNIRLEPIDNAGNNALLIDFESYENSAQKLAVLQEILAKKIPAHLKMLLKAIYEAPPQKLTSYIGGTVWGSVSNTALPPLAWEQSMQQQISLAAQAENIMQTDLPQLAWRQDFAENIFAAADMSNMSETKLPEMKG